MNLAKKKELAAKALNVGKNRINFNSEGLSEIKEAITKQDIKDLSTDGIITIKEVSGRKKIKKRKSRRGPGKIKKTVNKRKQIYVKITRKLRDYLKQLKSKEIINRELYINLRKKIRMRTFKSKAHMKDYLENTEKISIRPKDFVKQTKNKIKIDKKSKEKKKWKNKKS